MYSVHSLYLLTGSHTSADPFHILGLSYGAVHLSYT